MTGRFALLVIALFACVNVFAQTLPVTELKVLGGLSTRPSYKEIELPFWSNTVASDSGGQIKVDVHAFDEVGIKGPDLLKLTSQGVAQFATVPLSYYTSEQPINEAVDLAGLYLDTKTMRASVQAFEPIFEKLYQSNFGLKTLGVSAGSPQLLFCRFALHALVDLKGKTVRTITRSQAEFIQALGGKTKTLAMADVSSAFKDKSIDCAVATAMTAYQSSWNQVASHIFALPLGWNQELHVVNSESWDKLDPAVQLFLKAEIKKLLDSLAAFSNEQHKSALSCLLADKSCIKPVKQKMSLVQAKPQDLTFAKTLFKQKVLPRWAKRCNAVCVNDFNATIGKLNGIVAKK
jgi:TRAP-type C4-dicarboxylate transport system substrate-binding protein